jgi:hypothetical protein
MSCINSYKTNYRHSKTKYISQIITHRIYI